MPAGCDRRSHGSHLTVSTVRGCTGLDRLERAAFWRRWPSHPIPAAAAARPRKNRGSPRIWQVAPTSNGRLVTTRLAATEPHGITKDRHRKTSGLTPIPGRLPTVAAHSRDGTQPTMTCSNLERSRSCVP